jgi:hypothetical protein
MGDPHNPARAGEIWNPIRLELMEREVLRLAELTPEIVISGGWAWHFMSPPHTEIKIYHDHKDVDILVPPTQFGEVLEYFDAYGYERSKTKYDNPSGNFYRYTKYFEGNGKVVFDVFLEIAPFVQLDKVKVAEPKYLLSLYGTKHTSEECAAVIGAKKLIANGISPIGNKALIGEYDGQTKGYQN